MLVAPAAAPDVLKPFFQDLVAEIEALKTPMGPSKLWAAPFADMPPADQAQEMAMLVTDKHAIAVSTFNGTAWAWTRADGSAL